MPLASARKPLARAALRPAAPRPAVTRLAALAATLTVVIVLAAPALASAAPARGPNLSKGAAYLVAPANLIDGHYYQSFPKVADFGLTIDGAFALAATGQDTQYLQNIAGFIDSQGKDQSGRTVNDWTGIGTRSANGGSIAKEALLAEVVGDNPRDFAGHDLIAALEATVCLAGSPAAGGRCAGRGNYGYAASVFDQSLGVIAQLRAGQTADAAAPIAFLESLRNADGSFPSLIPDSHDQDIDSTAIAVMALALARGQVATADVGSGLAWIASQQERSGGFHGAGGVSINSAGLAIQALTLRASRYRGQIRAALAFLASEQNPDGGFNADARGQPGSNLRASTQAVSGATGISFGTLSLDLRSRTSVKTVTIPAAGSRGGLVVGGAVLVLLVVLTGVLYRRSRQARNRVSS
jgi:hypothetical protein